MKSFQLCVFLGPAGRRLLVSKLGRFALLLGGRQGRFRHLISPVFWPQLYIFGGGYAHWHSNVGVEV